MGAEVALYDKLANQLCANWSQNDKDDDAHIHTLDNLHLDAADGNSEAQIALATYYADTTMEKGQADPKTQQKLAALVWIGLIQDHSPVGTGLLQCHGYAADTLLWMQARKYLELAASRGHAPSQLKLAKLFLFFSHEVHACGKGRVGRTAPL